MATKDGFGAFFEAVVSNSEARVAYSATPLAERSFQNPAQAVQRNSGPFRLALVDSMWVYDEPGKDAADLQPVSLDFHPQGRQMRVNLVRAVFSVDEEVSKTLGKPEGYVVEHTGQCWKLTQHLQ